MRAGRAESRQEIFKGAAAEAGCRSGAGSQYCTVTVKAARWFHMVFLEQNLLQRLCEQLRHFGCRVTPGGRSLPGLL